MNAPQPALTAAERHRFTADQFLRIYEQGLLGKRARLRLIGGEIYHMAPTGPEHSLGHGRLIGALFQALSPRFEIAIGPTVTFSEHDVAEPDAVVLDPGPRSRQQIQLSEIQLIVETASSSLKDDTTVMAGIYAAAGVADYWVVDLDHQKLVVFRKPGPDGYAETLTVEPGNAIAPLCAPDAAIAVADLF